MELDPLKSGPDAAYYVKAIAMIVHESKGRGVKIIATFANGRGKSDSSMMAKAIASAACPHARLEGQYDYRWLGWQRTQLTFVVN